MKEVVTKLIPKRKLKNIKHPISRYLIKNNLTIKKFVEGNKLGITSQFISMLINGKRYPARSNTIKIARAIGVRPEALIFPEENYTDN